jgi:hypothetical protein
MGSDDTSTYPGSGPSSPEVNPYILLVLYYEKMVATMLLELCFPRNTKTIRDLSTLRV